MRRRQSGDRGAVLVLFSLSLVALVTVVCFAVDLGQARFSKRNAQSVADLAALDAGYQLSGRGDVGSPVGAPDKACVAAVQSIVRNVRRFRPAPSEATITASCNALPASMASCVPTVPRSVNFRAGELELTVRYPVPTTELNTEGFAGPGVNDGSECERMRVGLVTSDETAFASVIGADRIRTTASATVRANASSNDRATAALLLLERVGCGVLQTSGGGSSGSGVYVQRSSSTVGGIISADSAGLQPPCSGNTNASGWVVFGTALPSGGGGGPSITAEAASPTIPGKILVYAAAVGGRAGYTAPAGLNVAPTPGPIASRQVSDDKYNGVNAQVATLHADANAATANVPATGWTVVSGSECSGSIVAAKLAAAKVFVDCPTFAPASNVFSSATDFVVRGNIDIKSNKTLSLPVVRRVYVRGCIVGGCAGNNTFAVKIANGGTLLANTGQTALPGTVTCASRKGPGAGGTTTNTTRFAAMSGGFSVSGLARLCQTSLYLTDGAGASYTRKAVTAGGVSPEQYPPIARCSSTLPCPKNSADPLSTISFNGGAGAADWTAPNQLSTSPTPAEMAYGGNPFEDLALWTESSGASDIKGQGTNSTQGVFFLPNAPFTFQGQGTQVQPLNAQFLTRTMDVSGQGSLVMRPNPDDSLKTATVGSIALIR